MHYLIDFYGVPGILAIIIALLMGLVVGWVNGFLTVTLGLPSFVTTLGTGFVLQGLMLITSHGSRPPSRRRSAGHRPLDRHLRLVRDHLGGRPRGHLPLVLRRTRWGLHTIAVGGNQLGAQRGGRQRRPGSSTATS